MRWFFRHFSAYSVLLAIFFGVAGGQAQTPQTAENLLVEASRAFENGDLKNAGQILERILKIAPADVAAQTLAGVVADRENNLPKAEKHFAAAVRLAPASPAARNNYGAILLRLNRRAEAARQFEASLAANPAQASALVNLAQIRLAENDLAAARSLFEKAKAIQPDAEIARALLFISVKSGDAARAKSDFEEYYALAGGSTDRAGRAEIGALLLEKELNAEAMRELEAALALDPSDVKILILLARAHLRQSDVRAAGRLLESALARGADDARIYAALADVYQAGGYTENAIPAMRLAVEKEPKNEFYRARYGLLLIDARAPAAAVIRLAEAVKEFPNSSRLWLTLGIAQQIEGKMLEARASFEKSLQLDSASVPALAYLATSLIEQAQYAEAVKIYERALALEERNAILHYLLADTLLKMPNADAARIERHLDRAVRLDEKLGQAHLALGRLYVRAENWEKALTEFEQAVRYSPDVAEAHYQLGRVLARFKRAEESRAAFEKYKKLNETQTSQKETDRRDLVRRLANVRF